MAVIIQLCYAFAQWAFKLRHPFGVFFVVSLCTRLLISSFARLSLTAPHEVVTLSLPFVTYVSQLTRKGLVRFFGLTVHYDFALHLVEMIKLYVVLFWCEWRSGVAEISLLFCFLVCGANRASDDERKPCSHRRVRRPVILAERLVHPDRPLVVLTAFLLACVAVMRFALPSAMAGGDGSVRPLPSRSTCACCFSRRARVPLLRGLSIRVPASAPRIRVCSTPFRGRCSLPMWRFQCSRRPTMCLEWCSLRKRIACEALAAPQYGDRTVVWQSAPLL